jgi:hypothetical protein
MYIKDYNTTDLEKKLIAMSRDEYDEFMCKKFPMLFAQRNLSPRETCMYWGFDIGPGWYPLLHELCEKLMIICDAYNFRIEFSQIKEKYGSGRFYFNSMGNDNTLSKEKNEMIDEIINDIINSYEEISNKICATTGKWYDEKISIYGWIHDSCPEAIIKSDPERYKAIVENEMILKNKIKEIKYCLHYVKDYTVLDEIIKLIESDQN